MIKYCIRISLPALLFVTTFFSCSEPEPPNLDSWLGKYTYEEEPIAAGEDYKMVMQWDLVLWKDDNNKYLGDLNINGQQTAMTVAGDLVGNDQSISFIYQQTIEGVNDYLKPGDTLLMLSKSGGSVTTHWRVLKPRLSENPPGQCNCFNKTKFDK